jgi:WhiB family redox-sensing transcriptional regulator
MFQNLAACTPADEHIMFSELASKVARAKAICASCPVASKCLQFALDEDIEFGIFGGLTRQERLDMMQPA